MEELYSIMRDLLEVEYHQDSLFCLLAAVEAAYTEGQQAETKLVANGAKYYLKVLQGDLDAAVSRLDSYLAENAKRQ